VRTQSAPVIREAAVRRHPIRQWLHPAARERLFWGYLMIAPTLLGLLIFYIWPVFQTLYFSFTEWGAFGTYSWTGLDNYRAMLQDSDLLHAFRNTFLFTIISVPLSIALSIIVAVLLNQDIRGKTIYRTIYFLPAVTMPAAIAMVWKWLYNGDYGLINTLLGDFGIKGPHWTADPHTALAALIIVAIWGSIGYNMVIFLAGLQSIPGVYYEAASIDGAGPLSRFFHITLPLLSPTIFFSSVISLINALQVFDLIYLMFGLNNPALSSVQSIVFFFYQNAFVTNNKGYAAAIAMVLFAIILALTVVQLRLQRRWVHYG
jgi:multiple sugar transport system permease protein